MAQRTVTILTDDLDGTEGNDVETINFGLDGAAYEIDLTPKNREKLTKALTPFLDKARKAPKSASTVQKARAASNRDYDPKAVRAWAQSNKVDVPERGRIPMTVVEQYKAQGGI
jgi:hypothetical protein